MPVHVPVKAVIVNQLFNALTIFHFFIQIFMSEKQKIRLKPGQTADDAFKSYLMPSNKVEVILFASLRAQKHVNYDLIACLNGLTSSKPSSA